MGSEKIVESLLKNAYVAPEVFKLRPDYRALLMVVEGIPPSPSNQVSEKILSDAEASTREALKERPVNDIPHVASWQSAYKAFGAKPKKTRNSLEALMRRVDAGLPRVNWLTDVYNAISIKHQIPVGGEDLDRYNGSPFLIRATGQEKFETNSGGEAVVEHPDVGEVVWCDASGVTCRRWNWRQCKRTAISDGTTSVLFILDALDALSDDALSAAADDLESILKGASAEVRSARRLISAAHAS